MVQKEEIINHIIGQLEIKIETIQKAIADAKESRDNETKSSVGDKYETGRAMVQMEIEKNQAQLGKTEVLRTSLSKINLNCTHATAEFGSLVFTPDDVYFISIPFGKIEVDHKAIFCISLSSPIGKLLAGKTIGDTITFQNKKIQIKDIC